jgi:hypothetical protein
MLFFITGASGSGKSTCLPLLMSEAPEIAWHDFDEVGVPSPCPPEWRAQTTEHWIRTAIENQAQGQKDTAILGGAILGEVLACPSAEKVVGGIAVLLLDCDDVTRIRRLRARGWGGDTQDMLSWAAWQRMHAVDPQWHLQTIRHPNAWDALRWETWEGWEEGDPRWRVTTLDNSHLTPSETAARILAWMRQVSR